MSWKALQPTQSNTDIAGNNTIHRLKYDSYIHLNGCGTEKECGYVWQPSDHKVSGVDNIVHRRFPQRGDAAFLLEALVSKAACRRTNEFLWPTN